MSSVTFKKIRSDKIDTNKRRWLNTDLHLPEDLAFYV